MSRPPCTFQPRKSSAVKPSPIPSAAPSEPGSSTLRAQRHRQMRLSGGRQHTGTISTRAPSAKYSATNTTSSMQSAPPPSDAPSLVGERKRHRTARWEGLEEELLQWVFRHEVAAGEGSVTGSMLRQRATKLWSSMPCYQGQPLPKWSEGWKTRFRARYNLRKWDMLWEAVTLATVDEPDMSSNADSSVALPPRSVNASVICPKPASAFLKLGEGKASVSPAAF